MLENTPESAGSEGSLALSTRPRFGARKAWIVGSVVALILLLVIVLVVGPLPVWLARGNYAGITTINGRPHTEPGTADRIQAINAARSSLITLLVGTITGLGLIGGLLATVRNLRLTRESIALAQRNLELTATRDRETQALALQGHVTDRYSKAVEQLGDKDSLHVRLGGIYALERIAADSTRDLPTIVEVLSAFVRESKQPCDASGTSPSPDRCTPDAEAALRVLLREPCSTHDRPLDFHGACLAGLELSNEDLRGVCLNGANLKGGSLSRCKLEKATFRGADLSGLRLYRTNASKTGFVDVNLTDASIAFSECTKASFRNAVLVRIRFTRTNAHGVDFLGADLTDATFKDTAVTNVNFGDATLHRAAFQAAGFGTLPDGRTIGGVSFDGVRLNGAHAEAADFRQVRNMTRSQLGSATVDATTIRPASVL